MAKERILAVIPARKGSQGIKGKNVKELLGKKLISYTLEAAIKSKLISKIIVSTDSDEIISYSNSIGINVLKKRPDYLCDNESLTVDVLLYEINKLVENNEFFDYILLLQPTCPLRTTSDIDQACNLIKNNKCDSVISVVDVDGNHPLRMKSIREEYLFNYIETGIEDMRPRQKLPKVYIRNGAIYLSKMDYFLKNKSFGSSKTFAYIMPEDRSINIDSEKDFFLAEYFLKKLKINIKP